MGAREHLQAALDAMIAERQELDRNIVDLRKMLGLSVDTLDATQIRAAAVGGPQGSALSPPSVREVAMRLLATQGEFTLSEMSQHAAGMGNHADPATISSVLSRMKKKGDLAQVGKGRYGPVVTKSEAPGAVAATGASNSLSDREEVMGNETEHPDSNRDHHPAPITG